MLCGIWSTKATDKIKPLPPSPGSSTTIRPLAPPRPHLIKSLPPSPGFISLSWYCIIQGVLSSMLAYRGACEMLCGICYR